jgi:Transposase
MRKSRFSEGQIIGILKEHQAGLPVAEICRRHGISDATFYTWRSKYGGLEVSEAKRLKALECSLLSAHLVAEPATPEVSLCVLPVRGYCWPPASRSRSFTFAFWSYRPAPTT